MVLDCSVAAKWILPEPDAAPALALLDRYIKGDVLLIAPDLLLIEFAGLLAKRHRRKLLSAAEARAAFSFMAKFAPRLFDMAPRLPAILDMALRHRLSFWDCHYLLLGLDYHCPIVTADLRLFRTAKAGSPRVHLLQQARA